MENWRQELLDQKAAATTAGREAFRAGQPCEAPEFDRRDMEACWRLGWKREAAKSSYAHADA